MLYKTINLAPITFLDNTDEVKNLEGNWVKYSDLIYIKQPSKDTRIPTKFENSLHFEKLRKIVAQEKGRTQKTYPNYQNTICVACMFVDCNGIEIVSSTQDSTLHQFVNKSDSMCVREVLKQQGKWKSEDGYEMCAGCAADNHGEQNTIYKATKEGKIDQLKGATAYIHNHWWACDDCRQKMFDLGVVQIVLDPVCERIFGDKPVVWYRGNVL
jgi:Cytidine and deoxycytidylate deaminase zinc-binding region